MENEAQKQNNRVAQIKIRRKKYLDKHLQQLKDDPKYKDIMEKYEASSSNTLDFLVNTETIGTTNDDIAIYTEAELIMEMVINGELTLGNLDLKQKIYLLYYLERYNKRVGRILDIQTRIPLSSMRLQKPQTQFQIVNDYILKKFEDVFNTSMFQEMLEKVVRHYWLFSYGAVLIEDDYEFLKGSDILNDLNIRKGLSQLSRVKSISDLDQKELESVKEIDAKYAKSPSKVNAKERKSVLDRVLKEHAPKYKGPIKFTVLSALSTLDRNENRDIDYYIYRIPITENLTTTIQNIKESLDYTEDNWEELIDQIEQVGYTRAMVNAAMGMEELGSVNKGEKVALVDNDPYNSIGMYVAVFQRSGLALRDNSLFNRVLSDAIDLAVSTRRLREKVNRGFKKDILVTLGEKEDINNIQELQDALTAAASSEEGTITVTNMNASVQDMDLNVNANLDLNEIIDNANRNISEGVGISESLITDSADAYANSFLKTVLMENEFVSFRSSIKRFIEKNIFEPLAIKWGFVLEDEWGDTIAVYPEIRYNRMTLARGSDDLAALQDMAGQGQIPMETVYEALGIDPTEALNKVREEQTTFLNPVLRDSFSAAVGEIVGQVAAQSKKMQEELSESLDIPLKDLTEALKKQQDDSGGY